MTEPAQQTAYLSLSDGHPHDTKPAGLYVTGHLADQGFVPTGRTIEGEGKVGDAEGTPGWMELLTGQFFGAMTARAPGRPYVEGTMTDEGFVPSSRDVVY